MDLCDADEGADVVAVLPAIELDGLCEGFEAFVDSHGLLMLSTILRWGVRPLHLPITDIMSNDEPRTARTVKRKKKAAREQDGCPGREGRKNRKDRTTGGGRRCHYCDRQHWHGWPHCRWRANWKCCEPPERWRREFHWLRCSRRHHCCNCARWAG